MNGFLKYLKIADEVDIMIFKNDNESITLKCFVYEVTSDSQLILSNPVSEGRLYPLEKSYVYYFRFYIENLGMYLFKGILKDRTQYDNLPSVIINLSSDIKKVQRRKFFRVNLMSQGNLLFEKQLSEDEVAQMKQKMLAKFKNEKDILVDDVIVEKVPFDTLDLSGGGLRILIKESFDLGEFLEGEFKISNDWVKFKGEVTRNEKKDDNRYEVGIKFLEVDANTQAKIVAYVFEIERNLIKKGLM
ncbi:flagellar brake protein [Fusibacter ferrireducens]|uniref:Flagellar brake protein n=1 Tax=Fusibacter ferrireducens TaxID=2785058 RepID=A0ABR9ZMP9_9FIRM|nr:PilZ domain-containing protein [Fusibacter ferrireducens]MBF4691747.1 flagellar brake protein [Fusibacter ferrireducens]